MNHLDTGKNGLWCCWLAAITLFILAVCGIIWLGVYLTSWGNYGA